MKQKYYNIKNLLSKNAQYNILLGERSNGKSYATKYMILWESFYELDYFEFLKKNKIPKKKVSICIYTTVARRNKSS